MIKKCFLYALLFASQVAFCSQQDIRLPSVGELRLRHRLGMLSAHEFAQRLADRDEVVRFMDERLTEQDKNGEIKDDSVSVSISIQFLALRIVHATHCGLTLNHVATKLKSYKNKKNIEVFLCACFLKSSTRKLDKEIECLRFLFTEHGLDINKPLGGGSWLKNHFPLEVVLAYHRETPKIKMLLDLGADITIPLMTATVNGRRLSALEYEDWQVNVLHHDFYAPIQTLFHEVHAQRQLQARR